MNKFIDEYTIDCTKEQIDKAIKLGARIKFEDDELTCNSYPIYPTAEQMIGWLETQGFRFEVEYCTMYCIMVHINNTYICNPICTNSRKEATLAAIDATLEYLSNNK